MEREGRNINIKRKKTGSKRQREMMKEGEREGDEKGKREREKMEK